MRSVAMYVVAALVAASALLSGCAALSNSGGGHHKLAKQAGAFKATPATRNANDRQRLTEALATIYADSTVHPLRYHARFVDLNGDGKREAVVYVTGPSGCAQGCDLYVLARDGDRYKAVSRIPTARAPVYELDQRHHGWHDLWVTTVGDAGGSHGQRMQYTGGSYVPVADNGTDTAARTPLIANLDGPGHAIPTSGHGQ